MKNDLSKKIKANILLAEDSVVNQEVTRATLQFFGCEVDIAENGKIAVERWQSGHYDLILMDCLMPEMDGYEATQEIRRLEPAGRRIPVIAISAPVHDDAQVKFKNSGMDDWLAKPFTTAELYDLLFRWLGIGKDEMKP